MGPLAVVGDTRVVCEELDRRVRVRNDLALNLESDVSGGKRGTTTTQRTRLAGAGAAIATDGRAARAVAAEASESIMMEASRSVKRERERERRSRVSGHSGQ